MKRDELAQALQWHPDRHITAKDKDYATQRFIEVRLLFHLLGYFSHDLSFRSDS